MTKQDWQADSRDVEAIVRGSHANPFAFLGLHEVNGQWVLRAFVPHAETLTAYTLDGTELGTLIPRHPGGFFEGQVKLTKRQSIRYRAGNAGGSMGCVRSLLFRPGIGTDG